MEYKEKVENINESIENGPEMDNIDPYSIDAPKTVVNSIRSYLSEQYKHISSLIDRSYFNKGHCELIYTLAHSEWKSGNYKESLKKLFCLSLIDPSEARYTEAVARNLFDLGNYRASAVWYSQTYILGVDIKQVILKMAYCYFMDDNPVMARICLDDLSANIENDPTDLSVELMDSYKDLYNKISMMREDNRSIVSYDDVIDLILPDNDEISDQANEELQETIMSFLDKDIAISRSKE